VNKYTDNASFFLVLVFLTRCALESVLNEFNVDVRLYYVKKLNIFEYDLLVRKQKSDFVETTIG
jgi:hypothetical protein